MSGDAAVTNEPIDVGDLPRLDETDFESLHPNYLRVRFIGDAVFAAIVVVAMIVGAFLLPIWVPLVIGAVLLTLTALSAWLQRLEVAHIGYLVREKDFSYRHGVISRSVATVPFARVQHVSIDRGPLDRLFGLASLEMRTAGADISVPGIDTETAARLKALVVDRAGELADAELTPDQEPATPTIATPTAATHRTATHGTATHKTATKKTEGADAGVSEVDVGSGHGLPPVADDPAVDSR